MAIETDHLKKESGDTRARAGANMRPLAVITGASVGIGYELARYCAENGFDLLVAADQAEIDRAAQDFAPTAPPWKPSRSTLPH